MTERFKRASTALFKAFFEGTLTKGNCGACAVGNIVASGLGMQMTKKELDDILHQIGTSLDEVPQHVADAAQKQATIGESWVSVFKDPLAQLLLRRRQCLGSEVSGYADHELRRIEVAFESNTKIQWLESKSYTEQQITADQYKGLCAVFEVLCELDQEPNLIQHKAKLRTHPKLEYV